MNKLCKKIIFIILIILIIPTIVIIIYKINFTGSFSNEQGDWGDFGDYFSGIVSPFFGLLTILIVLYALYRTIIKERFDSIYSFMKDHRSKEMSVDIKLLWDFYNKEEEIIKNKRKNNYQKELEKNIKTKYIIEHKKCKSLYQARRNVSQFYLQLSTYIKNNDFDKKVFFSIWTNNVLEIINKIIIPCELAIGSITGRKAEIAPLSYLIEKAKEYNS